MNNSSADIVLPTIDINDYFLSIPLWAENESKFEVMADDISGRIPVIRLDHWRDFAKLLESSFFNRPGEQLVFRGHRRYDWSMTPTLGRLAPNSIVTSELAQKQLGLFKQAVRGRINDNGLLEDESQENELWAVGQHYGLMTPLLDWTYSPYVALFFAFSKEDQDDEKENPYRAIYVLNKSFLEKENIREEIQLFEPKKDDHGRLVNQAGLFTMSPTDATIENKLTDLLSNPDYQNEDLANASTDEEANILAKYICKIYIKNEEQQACLKHLRRMNVHHASLFPDLTGASDYCNNYLTELEREKERDKSEIIDTSQFLKELIDIAKSVEDSKTENDKKRIASIVDLLKIPDEGSELSSRLVKRIGLELEKMINKNRVVDWQIRDDIRAKIKVGARIILRKYDYPESSREFVINTLLDKEIIDLTNYETEKQDEHINEATDE